MLAYITGSVDQELLLRNEFLLTENRILKNQIKGRLQLTDLERISLAEIAKRLGRMGLEEVAQMVRPETILGWHRKLIARKFDGSKKRRSVGRPATGQTIEDLVLQFAQENRSWGYRRIIGALSNLGHEISHQTVANVLKRHGLAPAPEREKKTLWKDFIRSHLETLAAVDFFTAEVWTASGWLTTLVQQRLQPARVGPGPGRGEATVLRMKGEATDCIDGRLTENDGWPVNSLLEWWEDLLGCELTSHASLLCAPGDNPDNARRQVHAWRHEDRPPDLATIERWCKVSWADKYAGTFYDDESLPLNERWNRCRAFLLTS